MTGNGKTSDIKRYDVYLVNLDTTIGHEIKKSRPCVIISPDEMNILRTVTIAPMTIVFRSFPFRVNILFQKKKGQVALDQIRNIDKTRLIKKLGTLNKSSTITISNTLLQIFS